MKVAEIPCWDPGKTHLKLFDFEREEAQVV
jgi:hypothetical protein